MSKRRRRPSSIPRSQRTKQTRFHAFLRLRQSPKKRGASKTPVSRWVKDPVTGMRRYGVAEAAYLKKRAIEQRRRQRMHGASVA